MFKIQIPIVVKNLLIINFLCFFGQLTFKESHIPGYDLLTYYCGLYPFYSPLFHFYQLFTHAFLHANFTHLFFNMLGLFMFGSLIERVIGAQRFLFFYFACVLGGALLHLSVDYIQNETPTSLDFIRVAIGASGGVSGLAIAYAFLFPNSLILFWFIPMKAKYFGIIFFLSEFIFAVGVNNGIANWAHLGGGIIGLIYALMLRKKMKNGNFYT
ncbi:MAG: rhomboid family intramembrane serine protease [Chitinophagaceae bacterium]